MVAVAGRRVPAVKVVPPALPTGFVPREHLSTLVEAAAVAAPVTTLRAHAGAGKTLLLADWARTSALATAWVSLDPTDDRPGRLPAAVAHAVAACVPALAGALLEPAPAGPDDPPTVGHLLAVLDTLPDEVRLVLDDVQELTDPAVLDELQTMIRYRPDRLRLVLAGRTPPPVSLARRRLVGGVVDLPGDGLRFSVPEAVSLLSRGGARMSSSQVERAHALTGGWAAGLALVAAAARRSVEVTGLLAAFPRGERATAAYLRDEVLGGLSEEDRTFLEDLSVAATAAPSLAAELTGRDDALPTLERLERETSLVAVHPGDGHVAMPTLLCAWFHGELDRRPAHRARLHVRAAEWSAANDLPAEALEHARASGDEALLARLVRGWAVPILLSGDREPLRRALAALAPAAVDDDPGLRLVLPALDSGVGEATVVALRGSPTEDAAELRALRAVADLAVATLEPADPARARTPGDERARRACAAAWAALAEALDGATRLLVLRDGRGAVATLEKASARAAELGYDRLARQCAALLATAAVMGGDASGMVRHGREAIAATAATAATPGDRDSERAGDQSGQDGSVWSVSARFSLAYGSLLRGRPTRPATTRPISSRGPVTVCTRPRGCSCTSSTAPPTWTRAGSPRASRRCRGRVPRSPTGSWRPRRPPWRRSSSTRPRSSWSGPRTPGPSALAHRAPRVDRRGGPHGRPRGRRGAGGRYRDGAPGARAPSGAPRGRADRAPRGRRRDAAPRRRGRGAGPGPCPRPPPPDRRP